MNPCSKSLGPALVSSWWLARKPANPAIRPVETQTIERTEGRNPPNTDPADPALGAIFALCCDLGVSGRDRARSNPATGTGRLGNQTPMFRSKNTVESYQNQHVSDICPTSSPVGGGCGQKAKRD